jgi:two-component system chemotaxis response regulator CheY
MAGESILIVDDSLAVQHIAQYALSAAGYDVTIAGNGAAALTCPALEDVRLIVMDSELGSLPGTETTRILKQHGPTHPIPVLLLLPEETVEKGRDNPELAGAAGYLMKPFESRSLVHKVEQILEQQNLDELTRQYLADAADSKMQELADRHITQAIERKTALIIERCIQNVTQQVDQRARQAVEERVTGLVNEKEQELVKMTVREVANSMVEKLALSKVEEAMHTILREETEKAVRRITDQSLPNQIREKSKEMLTNILPREVEKHLQKATEKMIPEISQQIIGTVENVANKQVPRAARELLPPVLETQISQALEQSLPRRVGELVSRELNQQMNDRIEPALRGATQSLRKTVITINVVFGTLLLGVAGWLAWMVLLRK